jgi:hypothetical protein
MNRIRPPICEPRNYAAIENAVIREIMAAQRQRKRFGIMGTKNLVCSSDSRTKKRKHIFNLTYQTTFHTMTATAS